VPFSPVNKKLDFSFNCGLDNSSPPRSEHHVQFDIEIDRACADLTFALSEDTKVDSDHFSPCRTRSGRVYESVEKKKRRIRGGKRARKSLRTRAHSGQSGTGSLADCSENGSEASDDNINDLGEINNGAVGGYTLLDDFPSLDMDEEASARLAHPPPLNYNKQPVSRFSQARDRSLHGIPSSPISSCMMDENSPVKHFNKSWPRRPGGLIPSSPIQSPSPPTNAVKAMRLFDIMSSPNTSCPISSPRSTPRGLLQKTRLLFDENDEHRWASAPPPSDPSFSISAECDSTSTEKNKSANINPFTPSAMSAASKKRSRSNLKRSLNSPESPLSAVSQEELQQSLDSMSDASDDETEIGPMPAKRVRVSDINITRYEQEFLELAEIASGEFGTVKKARHRLDGIVYAIKVTKNSLRVNSRDERVAMNEVFAHAALMKHKHVVRYYNSWVENGQVYIQNEYCEGGSLASQIEEFRSSGRRFTETELKRIIVNTAKGLQYIHSKQLVHLDIKPENIFISLEHYSPSPPRRTEQSTDSGAASGDHLDRSHGRVADHGDHPGLCTSDSSPGDSDRVHYKIGDLGHVAPIFGGEMSPEEGDCRYMAPEFLEMEVDKSLLTKADIFSLGLTAYEAASLKPLPKNSLDDPNYENIKRGDLPYLEMYSREFNALIRSLVSPDPVARPTAAKLLASALLNPCMNKSRSQLYKELKETREKLMRLEQVLGVEDEVPNMKKKPAKRLIGRGTARSTSCLM